MNMPSLKEAKVRDNRESIIRRDDYIVPSSIRDYGLGKGIWFLLMDAK